MLLRRRGWCPFNWVACFLPGPPPAGQDLQPVITKAILVVELARHTGALILRRSLAVRDDQPILRQLAGAPVQVGLGNVARAGDVSRRVVVGRAHVQDNRSGHRVIV